VLDAADVPPDGLDRGLQFGDVVLDVGEALSEVVVVGRGLGGRRLAQCALDSGDPLFEWVLGHGIRWSPHLI